MIPATAERKRSIVRAGMRQHARRRMVERAGLKLTRNLRGMIVSQMLSGRAVFLATGYKATRTIWLVLIEGRGVRVVYDEAVRELVTVLPLRPCDVAKFAGGRRR
jgi:hypothetical protein